MDVVATFGMSVEHDETTQSPGQCRGPKSNSTRLWQQVPRQRRTEKASPPLGKCPGPPYCHQIHKKRNELQLLRHELRVLKKAPFPAKRCGKTLLNIPSNMLVVKA